MGRCQAAAVAAVGSLALLLAQHQTRCRALCPSPCDHPSCSFAHPRAAEWSSRSCRRAPAGTAPAWPPRSLQRHRQSGSNFNTQRYRLGTQQRAPEAATAALPADMPPFRVSTRSASKLSRLGASAMLPAGRKRGYTRLSRFSVLGHKNKQGRERGGGRTSYQGAGQNFSNAGWGIKWVQGRQFSRRA